MTKDWKEEADKAWDSPSWKEAARESKGPMPYDAPRRDGGNGKAESDEISLPAGIICDGGAATAPRPKLIDGLLSTTGLVFLGGQAHCASGCRGVSSPQRLYTRRARWRAAEQVCRVVHNWRDFGTSLHGHFSPVHNHN